MLLGPVVNVIIMKCYSILIVNLNSDMQGIIWGEPDLAVTMQS